LGLPTTNKIKSDIPEQLAGRLTVSAELSSDGLGRCTIGQFELLNEVVGAAPPETVVIGLSGYNAFRQDSTAARPDTVRKSFVDETIYRSVLFPHLQRTSSSGPFWNADH